MRSEGSHRGSSSSTPRLLSAAVAAPVAAPRERGGGAARRAHRGEPPDRLSVTWRAARRPTALRPRLRDRRPRRLRRRPRGARRRRRSPTCAPPDGGDRRLRVEGTIGGEPIPPSSAPDRLRVAADDAAARAVGLRAASADDRGAPWAGRRRRRRRRRGRGVVRPGRDRHAAGSASRAQAMSRGCLRRPPRPRRAALAGHGDRHQRVALVVIRAECPSRRNHSPSPAAAIFAWAIGSRLPVSSASVTPSARAPPARRRPREPTGGGWKGSSAGYIALARATHIGSPATMRSSATPWRRSTSRAISRSVRPPGPIATMSSWVAGTPKTSAAAAASAAVWAWGCPISSVPSMSSSASTRPRIGTRGACQTSHR